MSELRVVNVKECVVFWLLYVKARSGEKGCTHARLWKLRMRHSKDKCHI
jgi:hypothetical protein